MYTIDREVQSELTGLIEDAVAQFCQDNMISGELAWIIAETYATAKVEQFKGNIEWD